MLWQIRFPGGAPRVKHAFAGSHRSSLPDPDADRLPNRKYIGVYVYDDNGDWNELYTYDYY